VGYVCGLCKTHGKHGKHGMRCVKWLILKGLVFSVFYSVFYSVFRSVLPFNGKPVESCGFSFFPSLSQLLLGKTRTTLCKRVGITRKTRERWRKPLTLKGLRFPCFFPFLFPCFPFRFTLQRKAVGSCLVPLWAV
jgi:hypothetical protein